MSGAVLDILPPGLGLHLTAREAEWALSAMRPEMDEETVVLLAAEAVRGLLKFGVENGLVKSTEAVAAELSRAIRSDEDRRIAATNVLKLTVDLLSRKTIALMDSDEADNDQGCLYSVVNARLGNISTLSDGDAVSLNLRESYGDLTEFVRLAWEGLKRVGPPVAAQTLYCGAEIRRGDFDQYSQKVGRFVAWPEFRAFSTNEDAAALRATATQGGVAVIFKLSSVEQPVLKLAGGMPFGDDRVLHPFYPLQVEGVDVNATPKVVTLVSPDVLRKRWEQFHFDAEKKELHITAPASSGLPSCVILWSTSAERLVIGRGCTALGGGLGRWLKNVRTLDFSEATPTVKVASGAFVGMKIDEVRVPGECAGAWEFCKPFIDAFELSASPWGVAFEPGESWADALGPRKKADIRVLCGAVPLEGFDWREFPELTDISGVDWEKLPKVPEEMKSPRTFGKLASLPSGLIAIDDEAFSGCSALALSVLPPGLNSIGRFAFKGCTSLRLTSLPWRLREVGDGAFEDGAPVTLASYVTHQKKVLSTGTLKALKRDVVSIVEATIVVLDGLSESDQTVVFELPPAEFERVFSFAARSAAAARTISVSRPDPTKFSIDLVRTTSKISVSTHEEPDVIVLFSEGQPKTLDEAFELLASGLRSVYVTGSGVVLSALQPGQDVLLPGGAELNVPVECTRFVGDGLVLRRIISACRVANGSLGQLASIIHRIPRNSSVTHWFRGIRLLAKELDFDGKLKLATGRATSSDLKAAGDVFPPILGALGNRPLELDRMFELWSEVSQLKVRKVQKELAAGARTEGIPEDFVSRKPTVQEADDALDAREVMKETNFWLCRPEWTAKAEAEFSAFVGRESAMLKSLQPVRQFVFDHWAASKKLTDLFNGGAAAVIRKAATTGAPDPVFGRAVASFRVELAGVLADLAELSDIDPRASAELAAVALKGAVFYWSEHAKHHTAFLEHVGDLDEPFWPYRTGDDQGHQPRAIATLRVSLASLDEVGQSLSSSALALETSGSAGVTELVVHAACVDDEMQVRTRARLGATETDVVLKPLPADGVPALADELRQTEGDAAIIDMHDHGGANGSAGETSKGESITVGVAELMQLGEGGAAGKGRITVVRGFPCQHGKCAAAFGPTAPAAYFSVASGQQTTCTVCPVLDGGVAKIFGAAGERAWDRAVRFNGPLRLDKVGGLLGFSMEGSVVGNAAARAAALHTFRAGPEPEFVYKRDVFGDHDENLFETRVQSVVMSDGTLPKRIDAGLIILIGATRSRRAIPPITAHSLKPAVAPRVMFSLYLDVAHQLRPARLIGGYSDHGEYLTELLQRWSRARAGRAPGRIDLYSRSGARLNALQIEQWAQFAFGSLADDLVRADGDKTTADDKLLAAIDAASGSIAG